MLPQKTESHIPQNAYTSFSVNITPSNRIQFALKPVKEFHNQIGSSKPKLSRSEHLCLGTPILLLSEQLLRSKSKYSLNFWFWLLIDVFAILSESESSLLASHSNCKQEKSDGLEKSPRPKKFTRRGRQTILDAAGALEKEGFAATDFYFFTGTLPASTGEAMKVFASSTRQVLNSLKQVLRNLKLNYTFNTWEWQKRGALHLHLVVYCPQRVIAQTLSDRLRKTWLNLMDLITEQTGVDMYARKKGGSWSRLSKAVQDFCTKTIRCEKSVAAYLSKYVGKGSRTADKAFVGYTNKSKSNFYYPSSWWSISNSVRKLIQKHSSIFSVTLPNNKAVDAWAEVVKLIEPASVLTLNLFSPDGYPDYVYQSMYIKPELYSDTQTLLATTFSDPKYVSEDTGHATLPTLSEIVKHWFQLSRSTCELLDFQ